MLKTLIRMKKLLFLITWLLLLSGEAMAETQILLHVMSDPHVLAPEYTVAAPPHGAGKVDKLSADILRAAVDQLIAAKPADKQTFLLITGDMTYNGERASHEYVAAQLGRLRAAGIECMVIPGNHDILNRHALDSKTEDGKPAEMVGREDFRLLYTSCGYEEADAVCGLSYARRLGTHLAIICLDDVLDDGGKTYYSDGALSSATLDWMVQQAHRYHAEGRAVIAAVHHQVMEHFMGQTSLAADRLVNGVAASSGGVSHADVQKAFVDAGIQYVFTGHFHTQDAKRLSVADSQGKHRLLYDISTGSLSCYPNYIRHAEFSDNDFSLSVSQVPFVRDEALLRSRGVGDWTSGSFSDYSKQCLHEFNSLFVADLLKRLLGMSGSSALIKPLLGTATTRVAAIFDELYAGRDEPVDEEEHPMLYFLLDAFREQLGLSGLYYVADSMKKNYVGNPSNFMPDNHLTHLPVEVLPSEVSPIERIPLNVDEEFSKLRLLKNEIR